MTLWPAMDKSSHTFSRQHDGALGIRGTVYSFTLVQEPPAGFEGQSPYILALVELDKGGLITAQLTDMDAAPEIGERVEMVTRKLTTDGSRGMIVYGYKFRPLIRQDTPAKSASE